MVRPWTQALGSAPPWMRYTRFNILPLSILGLKIHALIHVHVIYIVMLAISEVSAIYKQGIKTTRRDGLILCFDFFHSLCERETLANFIGVNK